VWLIIAPSVVRVVETWAIALVEAMHRALTASAPAVLQSLLLLMYSPFAIILLPGLKIDPRICNPLGWQDYHARRTEQPLKAIENIDGADNEDRRARDPITPPQKCKRPRKPEAVS
jgi:hypothetical protein